MSMDAPVYEPMPDPGSGGGGGPGRKILIGVLVLVVVAMIGAAGAGYWFTRQANPSGPTGRPVEVDIPFGSSAQRIAAILEEKGVIDSAQVFRLYVRTKGAGPFQAGSYSLRRNEKFDQIIAALEKGPKLTFQRFTVPEGLTVKQLAERVGRLPGRSAERFLEVVESGQIRSRYQPAGSNNLEGLLLPETYNFEEKDDEAAIAKRMVDSFDAAAAEVGIEDVTQGGLVTPYEAVIVASLVEREARRDVDRGPVARVIYNRLKKDMLLQIDATVIYALGRTGEKGLRVLHKDLEVDSPYNTYKVKGLPPTPIASPGRAALRAAVSPTPGDALFYVTINDCTGETVFAETNAEHERNVARRRSQNPDSC